MRNRELIWKVLSTVTAAAAVTAAVVSKVRSDRAVRNATNTIAYDKNSGVLTVIPPGYEIL